eukprot:m.13232 g.13232  ORF g.13232 m.13232 type:complete len:233 (-) comp7474_c0_seq1:117-815(-)
MEELGKKLALLGIDDEDTVEYFQSLLDDEDQDQEGLCEFAADYCDDEKLVDDVVGQIWKAAKEIDNSKQEQEQKKPTKTFEDILQQNAVKLKEIDKEESEKAANEKSNMLTEEEKAAIVRGYGEVEVSDSEDEEEEEGEGGEGEVVIPTKVLSEKKEKKIRKNTSAQDYSMSFVNTNRESLDSVRKQKIDHQRKQAKAKAVQDKSALETDKQNKAKAKEMRRAKTQKHERRR